MALSLLEERGIKITEREAAKFTTAGRYTLRLGSGFWEKPTEVQAMILSHELVHYCQRDALGDREFELAYAHSAGRWRVEVPAYSQSIRTMSAQAAGEQAVENYVDDKLMSMRDFYWLWDIDQVQYFQETRRAWEAAIR
jgi:hypothetical protein